MDFFDFELLQSIAIHSNNSVELSVNIAANVSAAVNAERYRRFLGLLKSVCNFLLPVIAVGILLNIAEVVVFRSKSLRSRSSTLLAICSASNIVVSTGALLKLIALTYDLGSVMIGVANTVDRITDAAFFLTMVATCVLAYERMRAVMDPFFDPLSLRRIVLCTIPYWLYIVVYIWMIVYCRYVSLAWEVTTLERVCNGGLCLQNIAESFDHVTIGVLPGLFLTFCAIKTMLALRQQARDARLLTNSQASDGNAANSSKVVLLVSAIYVVTVSFPALIYVRIAAYTCTAGRYMYSGWELAYLFLQCCGFSSFDSFVYLRFNRRYRTQAFTALKCLRKCLSRTSKNERTDEEMPMHESHDNHTGTR